MLTLLSCNVGWPPCPL